MGFEQAVKWVCNIRNIFLHKMDIYLCDFDVCMVHQLLNHTYIDSVFQQMNGEEMTKRIATESLGDAGFIHCRLHHFLQTGVKNMAKRTPRCESRLMPAAHMGRAVTY